MHPLTFVLDTGAGPNLMEMTSLCPTWQKDIEPSPVPQLHAASGQPLVILGVLALFVRIGDLRFKVTFGVIDGLVTGALLSTFLLKKFVKGIYPTTMRVQPVNSLAIPLWSRDTIVTDDAAITDAADQPDASQFVRFPANSSPNRGQKHRYESDVLSPASSTCSVLASHPTTFASRCKQPELQPPLESWTTIPRAPFTFCSPSSPVVRSVSLNINELRRKLHST